MTTCEKLGRLQATDSSKRYYIPLQLFVARPVSWRCPHHHGAPCAPLLLCIDGHCALIKSGKSRLRTSKAADYGATSQASLTTASIQIYQRSKHQRTLLLLRVVKMRHNSRKPLQDLSRRTVRAVPALCQKVQHIRRPNCLSWARKRLVARQMPTCRLEASTHAPWNHGQVMATLVRRFPMAGLTAFFAPQQEPMEDEPAQQSNACQLARNASISVQPSTDARDARHGIIRQPCSGRSSLNFKTRERVNVYSCFGSSPSCCVWAPRRAGTQAASYPVMRCITLRDITLVDPAVSHRYTRLALCIAGIPLAAVILSEDQCQSLFCCWQVISGIDLVLNDVVLNMSDVGEISSARSD